jgi:hypothetical protein
MIAPAMSRPGLGATEPTFQLFASWKIIEKPHYRGRFLSDFFLSN